MQSAVPKKVESASKMNTGMSIQFLRQDLKSFREEIDGKIQAVAKKFTMVSIYQNKFELRQINTA